MAQGSSVLAFCNNDAVRISSHMSRSLFDEAPSVPIATFTPASSIFLTGGGLIMNRGGKEYLAGKLGKAVQETPRRTTKLNSHTFSSALGLLDLIIDTIERQHQPTNTFGGKIKEFFSSLVGG